ncbi:aldose 1-epimerase family protein [Pedococcus sp. 5OH_020]|uniref:aldose 1-epimerase family protein n=1 Tax=Pedococcus sp. 5OH_020 TaxID=2989814 RepID=UPI0022E9BD82|nr:aldose 1-epimerase family protein [Pedococcus sp. 5OH_020]
MSVPPSGEQWVIRHGEQEATLVEVGGGLRTYTVRGAHVLAGYELDEMALSGRGQVLMPWPNRIKDGRYSFQGTDYQLPLTEPTLHNASHGLVRWASWRLLAQTEDRSAATLGTRLHPQPGWPGTLDLTVTYTLGAQGLTVQTQATNVGAVRLPFGYGQHPYVALGTTSLAEVELTIPAAREVLVDDQSIPTTTRAVSPETDFRSARPLGNLSLDSAFTSLSRSGPTAAWEVVVGALAAGDVVVWGDRSFDWVQVFTVKGQDTGVVGTRGIAVEPMSCPANAFNSGEGLVVLDPGQSWSGVWGVRPAGLR